MLDEITSQVHAYCDEYNKVVDDLINCSKHQPDDLGEKRLNKIMLAAKENSILVDIRKAKVARGINDHGHEKIVYCHVMMDI